MPASSTKSTTTEVITMTYNHEEIIRTLRNQATADISLELMMRNPRISFAMYGDAENGDLELVMSLEIRT